LRDALDSLSGRRIVLIGGKGGVGKTTISSLAALHFARSRPVIVFTTDPASNLTDLFTEAVDNLTIESVDAARLYARFLEENLPSFLEIADRGTYLDREELRRFFELSLPGVDELMSWMRIGELAESHPDSMVVVDTAPTGHALRMIGAAEHFRQLANALDAMEEKHRGMVRQFMRRDVRDAMDEFIESFEATASRRREMLRDPALSAFVPVFLSEPWVVEQTLRLIGEVREEGIDVPFAVLNRAIVEVDCALCEVRKQRDDSARQRLAPLPVVPFERSCEPLEISNAFSPARRRGGEGRRARCATSSGFSAPAPSTQR
jgi:arsenite-transporting ATPase